MEQSIGDFGRKEVGETGQILTKLLLQIFWKPSWGNVIMEQCKKKSCISDEFASSLETQHAKLIKTLMTFPSLYNLLLECNSSTPDSVALYC